MTSENKEGSESNHVVTEGHLPKDKFTDLLAILQQPKHLGTVIVNSEAADENNPSLAEELNLKAK